MSEKAFQAKVQQLARLNGWTSLPQRLVTRIEFTDTCWLWLGYKDPQGYGRVRTGGRDTPVGYVHRVCYEAASGPIPDGLHIDHLCRVRHCCRPDHLEAVKPGINTLRGHAPSILAHHAGTCTRGHDASEFSRRKSNGKVVYCRACRRDQRRG